MRNTQGFPCIQVTLNQYKRIRFKSTLFIYLQLIYKRFQKYSIIWLRQGVNPPIGRLTVCPLLSLSLLSSLTSPYVCQFESSVSPSILCPSFSPSVFCTFVRPSVMHKELRQFDVKQGLIHSSTDYVVSHPEFCSKQ